MISLTSQELASKATYRRPGENFYASNRAMNIWDSMYVGLDVLAGKLKLLSRNHTSILVFTSNVCKSFSNQNALYTDKI